jgi:hypothetical protein
VGVDEVTAGNGGETNGFGGIVDWNVRRKASAATSAAGRDKKAGADPPLLLPATKGNDGRVERANGNVGNTDPPPLGAAKAIEAAAEEATAWKETELPWGAAGLEAGPPGGAAETEGTARDEAETMAAAGATAGEKGVPPPGGTTRNGLKTPEEAAKAREAVPATTEAYEGRIERGPEPTGAVEPGSKGTPEGVNTPEGKGEPKGALAEEAEGAADAKAEKPVAWGVTASESIEALSAT